MPIYAGSNLISTVRRGTVVLDNIRKGNAAALFSNCPALPAPASISVSAGNAQATATWADVAGAAGYQLQYREVGSAEWITTGHPNAPTSLTATAGNAQIALSWTAPSDPGTSAITDYVVEYTPSGGSAATVNTNSTSTSYTLTGLTNGTEYTVRVAAISAVGTGDYSSTATGTPVAPPAESLRLGAAYVAGNTYSLQGLGTQASPISLAIGGNDDINNRVWLEILQSGTLNYSLQASTEFDYDFGRLYIHPGPAVNQTIPLNRNVGFSAHPSPYVAVSAAVSGSQVSSGTRAVTAGEFLVVLYTRDGADGGGADTVSLSAYIT